MLRTQNTLPLETSSVSVVRQRQGSSECCEFKEIYTSPYTFLLHVYRDNCRHRMMWFPLCVMGHFIEITPMFNRKCCSKYKYTTVCNWKNCWWMYRSTSTHTHTHTHTQTHTQIFHTLFHTVRIFLTRKNLAEFVEDIRNILVLNYSVMHWICLSIA